MKLLLECARAEPSARAITEIIGPGVDWKAVMFQADWHGLVPLLYWRLQRICAELVPQEILDQARVVFHANTARNLRLASELAEVVGWLQSESIPVVPFKGPTLAAQAYENLGLRTSVDLDVLVPHTEINRAIQVLRTHGYQAKGAEGAEAMAGNNEIAVEHPGRADIDLHWTLSPVYFLQCDEQGLWSRLEQVELAGRRLPSLGPEDLFICLALHGARHCWASLRWICDVGYLSRRRPPDWDSVLRRADQLGCRRAVLLAIVLAMDITGSGVPASLLSRAQADRLVVSLAQRIRNILLAPGPDLAGTPAGAAMQLQLTDTTTGRLRYLWKRAFIPNQTDNTAVRLPVSMQPLMYLTRPLRIAAAIGKTLLDR